MSMSMLRARPEAGRADDFESDLRDGGADPDSHPESYRSSRWRFGFRGVTEWMLIKHQALKAHIATAGSSRRSTD